MKRAMSGDTDAATESRRAKGCNKIVLGLELVLAVLGLKLGLGKFRVTVKARARANLGLGEDMRKRLRRD